MHWTNLFPNIPFVFTFKLDHPDGHQPDFDPILRALKAQAQDEESLRRWYKDNPVSLLMMSVASHRHPTEVIQYMASHADLPIRCCQGMPEEFDTGRNCARAAILVADPAALSTLFVTMLWRQIARVPFKLFVTRSTLDGFLDIAESQRHSSGDRLASDGDELIRLVTPPDDHQRLIRLYEEFDSWLRSVTEIRSGIVLARLPHERRDKLTLLFGQAAAESIALALQEKVPLWTDDATVSLVMYEGQPTLRTWTQLVAERLRAEGCITDERFTELLAQLVGYGYQLTQLVPEAFLIAAEQSNWNSEHRPLRDVLDWLGDHNISEDGVLGVAIGGLRLVWRNAPLIHQREGITLAIGRSLTGRPGGLDLIRFICSMTERFFPVEPHVAEQCRNILLRSSEHFESGEKSLILPK